MVEKRERRGLYKAPSAQNGNATTERPDGELGTMLTLAEGIEKAQEERLDVSAYATAPAQVK